MVFVAKRPGHSMSQNGEYQNVRNTPNESVLDASHRYLKEKSKQTKQEQNSCIRLASLVSSDVVIADNRWPK